VAVNDVRCDANVTEPSADWNAGGLEFVCDWTKLWGVDSWPVTRPGEPGSHVANHGLAAGPGGEGRVRDENG
jgi:hypothetical protein